MSQPGAARVSGLWRSRRAVLGLLAFALIVILAREAILVVRWIRYRATMTDVWSVGYPIGGVYFDGAALPAMPMDWQPLGTGCDEPGALLIALVQDGYMTRACACDAFGNPLYIRALRLSEVRPKKQSPALGRLVGEECAGACWTDIVEIASFGADAAFSGTEGDIAYGDSTADVRLVEGPSLTDHAWVAAPDRRTQRFSPMAVLYLVPSWFDKSGCGYSDRR